MSRRLVTLAAAFAATLTVAACSETLDAGAGCPLLCAQVPIELRDTVVDAIVVDSSLSGFPAIGFEDFPLLANLGDTLETRVIIRFDTLFNTFRHPLSATVDSAVTRVNSAHLAVRLVFPISDSTRTLTIRAYDVDTVLPPTSLADTMVATLAPLFRPDRELGSVTFIPSQLTDSSLKGDSTVRIPIEASRLLAKVTGNDRLRVGLVIESSLPTAIRIVGAGAVNAVALRYRVTPDTSVAPIVVTPRSKTPTSESFTAAALADYQIVTRGYPLPTDGTLAVGGVPGTRTYLRFELPRRITDSSRVVRAALLLTQAPNPRSANRGDTLIVLPDVVLASETITNLRQAVQFSSRTFGVGGEPASIPVLRLVPADSGTQTIEMAALIQAWSFSPASEMPRALVLRAEYVGRVGGTVLFYSREAPASVRPRLRLTYAPRLEFGLP
ncbi:MAG: hypothetical protein H0X64_15120 [Gemmatimonadaceae bacterium]|nr:hypothetical protein [Gemmatimonadaceae bacterium]